MRETLERYYQLKSEINLNAEEAEEFTRVKRNVYYFYGQVRNIVEGTECLNLSPEQVKQRMTEEHYKTIQRYYGLNKNEIDRFLSCIYTPGSKKTV